MRKIFFFYSAYIRIPIYTILFMHVLKLCIIFNILSLFHLCSYTVPQQENGSVPVIMAEAKCSVCEDSISIRLILTYKYTIQNSVSMYP